VDLRLTGFDQEQNRRVFRFDGVTPGEPTVQFTISADLTLFLKHRIGLQEGPQLCARKLAADLENVRPGHHELTNEDLRAYVAARSAAEDARKARLRGFGLRRRNPGSQA
jgi:hypothetical protein